MACNANITISEACDSGIGKLTSRPEILQVIAQNLCSASLAPPDPYDGLLVYTRQGLGDTTVVNPSGAYDLTFASNKVTAIHCHNCPLITSLTCTTDALLTVLDLENCATLGNLVFTSCTALTSVNLSTFTSMSGGLEFHSCSALSSFLANSITSVGGNVALILTSIVNQSFNSLVSTGGYFGVNGNSLTTVTAPLLTTVGSFVYVSFSPLLTSLALPSLTTVTTEIYAGDCPAMTTISFPALVTAGGLLTVSGNFLLSSFSFPLLQVAGSIQASATALTELSLPSLASCVNIVTSPSNITSINIPFTGGVVCFAISATDSTSLTSLDFGGAVMQDGCEIYFDNCALNQASVDLILQSAIDGGTTTSIYDTSAGTSSAPSAGGMANKAALIIAGNTVTTN